MSTTVIVKPNKPAQAAQLFNGVKYFIASCISSEDAMGMRGMLDKRGAIEVKEVGQAEYVFSTSETFEGSNEVQKDTKVVMPQWIERSLMNNVKQDARFFSPSPRAIFSTLVFATDHLPPGDVEAVIAGANARGGMYRDALTKDVTHLLVLSPTGDKYETARKHASQTGIKIVLVHWFDDCFKTEHRLPEGPYEQPLLEAELEQTDQPLSGPKLRLSRPATLFYESLKAAESGAADPSSDPLYRRRNVWDGRRILLSHSLMLSRDRKTTVENEVQRHGGVVVTLERPDSMESADEPDSDEELDEDVRFEVDYANLEKDEMQLSSRYRAADRREAISVLEGRVDVLVTKYRSGLAYLAALHGNGKSRREITVATLAWLFNVQFSGTLTSPTDQLLHYPVRRGAVPEIVGKQITITNYQGPVRDYLKKLISLMAGARAPGAPEVFTATLSKQTSIVVASKIEGKKVESAQNWNIPIVNHLWLEDTFKRWKGANLADPKYTHWRSKISYSSLLPGCTVIEKGESELKVEAAHLADEMLRLGYGRELIDAALSGDLEFFETPVQESSGAQIERELESDSQDMEVDEDLVPETSSPRRNPITQKSSSQPNPSGKTPSTRRLVPVIEQPTDSAARQEIMKVIMASRDKTKAISPQVASPVKQPIGDTRLTTSELRAQLTAPKPSSLLRSPFDPSPKKSQAAKNESPVVYRRQDPASDSDSSVEDIEQAMKASQLQSRSPRGKKRDIRTQDSDEEFREETQDDLLSRRQKMVEANVEMLPKRARKSDEIDRTKVSVKPGIKKLRASIGGKARKPVGKTSLTPDPSEDGEHPESLLTSAASKASRPRASTRTSTRASSPESSGSQDDITIASRTKRSAATKATQILHEKYMPDANKFAAEMRRGDVRGNWEGKVRREATERKGQREATERKRRRDDPDTTERKRRRKSSEVARARSIPPTGIRVIATKVPLVDEVAEDLRSLGIQVVSDPLHCTHLVSNAILRTEKFLSALSTGPTVVTEGWIRECLEREEAVDPDPWLLRDDAGEAKFGMDLQQSVERARQNGRSLLDGHTFYLTTGLSDTVTSTLSATIKSAGGNVHRQLPSFRLMEDPGADHHRYIVSDASDRPKWEPFARRHILVHNQELVLRAVLRQQPPDPQDEGAVLAGG